MTTSLFPRVIATQPILALLDQLTNAPIPEWEAESTRRAMAHVALSLREAMHQAAVYPLMLGTAEAAEAVGKSNQDVAYHCRKGHFPGATKVGNEWLIPLEDLRGQFGAHVAPKADDGEVPPPDRPPTRRGRKSNPGP